MRAIVTIALTLLAASAVAQQSERRAPLADVDDLEPAVDVSEPRVAVAQGPATPAPAAAPSSSAPAAVSPPAPALVEPSPRAAERPAPRVMDSLDLGTTSITGNQELPKVLYIVPWKRSDLGDHVGRPVNTLLDEVLEPIDPEVFERHLDYYETLYGVSREE